MGDLQYTIMLLVVICNTFSLLHQIYFIASQSTVFINAIWTFGDNNILHSLLYHRQVIVFYYSAMCFGDLFWGCSWRRCCGQAFQFYSVPPWGASIWNSTHSTVAFTVTPSVRVRLHNLHVPIRFPLNHSPRRTPKPPHQRPQASSQWGKNS